MDLLGESEPWVFKGGIAGELQVSAPAFPSVLRHGAFSLPEVAVAGSVFSAALSALIIPF